ncbi:hypothetical protein QBC43DRAFT_288611 [Cladorrhinum sp. PSN259]|nr:hypothetical protein QBC43DRAFT_288611 [Cladorrhinum sp. PSN259]
MFGLSYLWGLPTFTLARAAGFEAVLTTESRAMVPRSVLRDLDKTVALREKLGAVIKGTSQPTQKDQSHEYFVRVLRNVR